jgi:hypothetical protein
MLSQNSGAFSHQAFGVRGAAARTSHLARLHARASAGRAAAALRTHAAARAPGHTCPLQQLRLWLSIDVGQRQRDGDARGATSANMMPAVAHNLIYGAS